MFHLKNYVFCHLGVLFHFGEFSNLSANKRCLTHFIGKQGLTHLPRAHQLVIALPTPLKSKYKLRTIRPEILFTCSFKKRVYNQCSIHMPYTFDTNMHTAQIVHENGIPVMF